MISKSLIAFLLSWISDNTLYNTKNFDTKIFLVESEEIQRRACNGKCPIVAFYKKMKEFLLQRWILKIVYVISQFYYMK